jgi:hypothetical protein
MLRLLLPLLLIASGCRARHGVSEGGSLVDGGQGPAQAVLDTIAHNPTCSSLPSFYWEIGDAHGALAAGSVGDVAAADTMDIASASKFLWGAYVVERFKDNLGAVDLKAMRMLSGYVSFSYDSCLLKATVSDCQAAGQNGVYTASDDGLFDYGGGHFQKYAVTLGLGGDNSAQLAADLKQVLGSELAFTYSSPQLAGGVNTSAADYAIFLRKILSGGLAIHDQLGAQAVCTQPSTCSAAAYSPAPAAWHYSYGHWVEDDPTGGDGAFSSPGFFGFYPWIDASKTHYGILARHALTPQAYIESAECGALLRRAFLSGQAQ